MNRSIKECIVKQVWCGDSNTIPTKESHKYYKIGSKVECLKKGFGVGEATERRKHLDPNSLQNIPYVGEQMETRFLRLGISTLDDLINSMSSIRTSVIQKNNLLKNILVNARGVLNKKAYNSVILYLSTHGVGLNSLPRCLSIEYK